MYDVIVVGAGPSGMMCAIRASQNGKKVLLLEKNQDIGKKMKITGGGRCNITNLKDVKLFVKSLPVKNGRFLYSALNQFSPVDIYQYFEQIGVPLKEENENKVFPFSNQSNDFIEAFKNQLNRYEVDVRRETEVLSVSIQSTLKYVKTTKGDFKASKLVIATGGKSHPQTGSTGFGYEVAKDLNHSVTELFPTESPLISHDRVINSKALQGLSFHNVKLSLVDENQKIIQSHTNDLIMTHFGLSGPAALKLSQFVYHYLKNHSSASVYIDFIPQIKRDDLINELKQKRSSHPQKQLKTILKGYIPQRLLVYLFNLEKINESLKIAQLSNTLINRMTQWIKQFEVKIHEVKPITAAFVTGGGVSIKEINPKTMESKLIPGLYFIGEVLDLHGYTGGYNITIALSTGYCAGNNV